MSTAGRIHSFESFGTLDGPGIRYVIFLQGCPLRCHFCHNPDTWHPEGGTLKSVAEILEQILSVRSFLRNGGVTLSGGEPLLQADFSRSLLLACREAGFHTALDTAGSLPLSRSRPVIDAADMLLLDIKALDDPLCHSLTGQSNANTLAVLDYCEENQKRLWIRHVLVPGMTLQEDHMRKLASFLNAYSCVERIELLPYHKMGAGKWKNLGLEDPLKNIQPPSPSQCEAARELFRQYAPQKTVY